MLIFSTNAPHRKTPDFGENFIYLNFLSIFSFSILTSRQVEVLECDNATKYSQNISVSAIGVRRGLGGGSTPPPPNREKLL